MAPATSWSDSYKVYPMSFAQNKDVLEDGNKTQMHIDSYPIQFRITNPARRKYTHCGVMEFSSPEGIAYLPKWMMDLLELQEEDQCFLKRVELAKGELVTFKPHFTRFTELANPRAVLEHAMKNFSCLTMGDTIQIHYDDFVYPFDVTKVEPDLPGHSISVIDTDLKVDFEEPRDYEEHMRQRDFERKQAEQAAAASLVSAGLAASATPVSAGAAADQKLSSSSFFRSNSDESAVASQTAPVLSKQKTTSEYFQRLGSGRRLKDRTSEEKKENGGGGDGDEKKEEEDDDRPRTEVVVKGQWKYIYSVNPRTHDRRLVKRVQNRATPTTGESKGRALNS